jgi:hypothetical protein
VSIDVPAIASAPTLASDATGPSDKTVPAVSTMTSDAPRSRFPLQVAIALGLLGTATAVFIVSRQQAHQEPTGVADSASATSTKSAAPIESAIVLPTVTQVTTAEPVVRPAPPKPVPTKPSCTPPYYMDHGIRIFKKECL